MTKYRPCLDDSYSVTKPTPDNYSKNSKPLLRQFIREQ